MKSGNLNFLEPSGPLQACNGTALPLPLLLLSSLSHRTSLDSLIRPTTAHAQSACYVNRLGVLCTFIGAFVRSTGCENPALDYHPHPKSFLTCLKTAVLTLWHFIHHVHAEYDNVNEYSWIVDKLETPCTSASEYAVPATASPPPTPFFQDSTALMGLGLLIVEVSRSH